MTVNVMVEQDGVETRVTMSDEAWAAIVAAADVGLDGATPAGTGLDESVLDEAWDALQDLRP